MREGEGTCASGGGIAALDEEAFDDAVENGVVEVAFETKLNEVPNSLRSLLGPELDVQRAVRRLYYHFPFRRRF